jgi:hypothetical protein
VNVALKNLLQLGCQVSSWDLIVVANITNKLGSQALAKWNEHLGDTRKHPSHEELDAFLRCCIHLLSASTSVTSTVVDKPRNRNRSFVNHTSTQGYVNCSGLHSLAKCEGFLSLAVEQRSTLAREKRVCFNCLRSGHFTPKCPSKSRCARCRRPHHTLLHPEEGRTTRDIGTRESGAGDPGPQAVTSPSSVVGNAIFAHVQATLPKVPREDRGVLQHGSIFISQKVVGFQFARSWISVQLLALFQSFSGRHCGLSDSAST